VQDDGLHRPRLAGALHRIVVVDPQQRDHVADVLVALDLTRCRALPVGEDGVVVDPPLLVQLRPGLLGEEEVGDAIAVQMADLALAEFEAELATLADPSLDAGPGRDLRGDLLAVDGGAADDRGDGEAQRCRRFGTAVL
jgi:hypothetical protein